MSKVLVLHGPNLNLLGDREPEHYGKTSLEQINQNLGKLADSENIALNCQQSNAEHELVDAIQNAAQSSIEFIIINPAAYTHTSVALRDALAATGIPFIEVHLSNVHAREEFRSKSYFSDIALGVICGLGAFGYELAFQAAIRHLKNK